jgi:hypothetical protein
MTPPINQDWLTYAYGRPADGDFDQEITTCAVDGEVRWGGISYYAAEGAWGVGGLVRERVGSGTYEYLRPDALRNLSVSTLIHFGGEMLLGTTVHSECAGPESGFGVRRYHPDANHVSHVTEVCGFAVRDFAIVGDQLWVATELGLARARRAGSGLEWQNFLPAPEDVDAMRPVECDTLYEELLRSPRLATDTSFDMGYAFEDFLGRLGELRPEFVARYMRRLLGHQPATR